jgi:hypothetical protein
VRIDARLRVLYLAGVGIALFHTGRAGVIGALLALQALLWPRAGLCRRAAAGASAPPDRL